MIKRHIYILGLLLGLLSAICSAIIAVILANHKQLSTSWILLIQSLFSLIVSTAIPLKSMARLEEKDTRLATRRYRLHVLRAMAGLSIYWFYYQSLKSAPKVDCSLLLNTAPLLVPFICIVAFRETVTYRVWIGVFAGFTGIMIVLLPELAFDTIEPGYFYALLAGLFFAMSIVVVRSLNETERVSTTVLFYNMHCVAVLCIVVTVFPEDLTFPEAIICVLVAIVFCVKQYAITLSIKHTSATVASVLNFATIPLLAGYSVVFEGTPLSTATFLGTVLVAFGTVALVYPAQSKGVGKLRCFAPKSPLSGSNEPQPSNTLPPDVYRVIALDLADAVDARHDDGVTWVRYLGNNEASLICVYSCNTDASNCFGETDRRGESGFKVGEVGSAAAAVGSVQLGWQFE